MTARYELVSLLSLSPPCGSLDELKSTYGSEADPETNDHPKIPEYIEV